MSSAIHHTGVTVSNLERALGFWRDALGMQEVLAQEKQGGYFEAIVCEPDVDVRMVHLAIDGVGPRIELFEFRSPTGGRVMARPADVGFAHVCIACDDLVHRLARLIAAGGVPFSEPVTVDSGANSGALCVYVRDPDGHVIELFQQAQTP